jgi:AcrR family transcriptional regulator
VPKQSIDTQSRSARPQSTRDRKFAAASWAFAEKGLAGTKLMDDILFPAGIAPGSFYYQFDDQVDLLLAVLDEYSVQYRDRLREVHRASPGRLIEDVCRDSNALLFELADSCTVFAYPRLDPTVRLLPVSIPEFPLRHLARLSAR